MPRSRATRVAPICGGVLGDRAGQFPPLHQERQSLDKVLLRDLPSLYGIADIQDAAHVAPVPLHCYTVGEIVAGAIRDSRIA